MLILSIKIIILIYCFIVLYPIKGNWRGDECWISKAEIGEGEGGFTTEIPKKAQMGQRGELGMSFLKQRRRVESRN